MNDPKDKCLCSGCVPTDPEIYAKLSKAAPAQQQGLPSKFDIIDMMTSVKLQDPYNACVAYAVCAVLNALAKANGGGEASEHFIWYQAKGWDNWRFGLNDDDRRHKNEGTSVYSALQAVTQCGSCWEKTFDFKMRDPSPAAFEQAATMKVTCWHRLEDISEVIIKATLHNRTPIIISFLVPDNYANLHKVAYTNGVMDMPEKPNPDAKEHHAVVLVGYDDATKHFTFKNSWGLTGKGKTGYYDMPYAYITYIREAYVVLHQDFPPHPSAPGGSAPVSYLMMDEDAEDLGLSVVPPKYMMKGFIITPAKEMD